MVTGDKGHNVFTQVRALSMEVKPYSCLINIDDMVVEELIYHEIREAKPYKLAYGMIVVRPTD